MRTLLLCIAAAASASAEITLTAANGSIGYNLQTYATVRLSSPTEADVPLTIRSSDPSRLLVAKTPEAKGSESITVLVRAQYRESPEFWLQALSSSGDVTYSVAAPGFEPASGTVTLAPSGIALIGPFGATVPNFTTTPKAWPSKLTLQAARLDSTLKFVESQYVRGGYALKFQLVSSEPAVGSLSPTRVEIEPATDSITVDFLPGAAGVTTLSAVVSPGYQTPALVGSVVATVKIPGIAIADDLVLGQNLQVAGTISLGEPAPEAGLIVRVTSAKPDQLLLSNSPTDTGRASILVKMNAGAVSTSYYLQGLGSAGEVTHTASAPGFKPRTGTIMLAPSGVILMPEYHGAPDEAELFRPATAGAEENPFVSKLSGPGTRLSVFAAYLDPSSRRSADITVQALRGGLTVPVAIGNANPAVGTVASAIVLKGGEEKATLTFTPVATGKTRITLATPDGFTTPSNARALLAIVQ